MISWHKAQEIILHQAPQMALIQKPLSEALGFVLGKDIKAQSDLPPFDNSAMDGFAVKSAWLGQDEIPYQGQVLAGHSAENMDENAAIAIMTGAKIPQGYDCVIPIENVEKTDNFIRLLSPAKKGGNIRSQGSDVKAGDIILPKGTKLKPYHFALLGGQGISHISVFEKPKIAVIITGDEVGSTNENSGKIADANGPFLSAAIAQAGGALTQLIYSDDNHENLAEKIKDIQPHVDLIISTGAVSAGNKDFIPHFIAAQKGEIYFHKIYQRPGKPLLFAQLNDSTAWFGLPGNPVAVQAGFDFSVKTWLRKAIGQSEPPKRYGVLKGCFQKKSAFRQFLRGYAYSDEYGTMFVELAGGQASYQLKNWKKSNSWLIAPEGVEQLNDGNIVEIIEV